MLSAEELKLKYGSAVKKEHKGLKVALNQLNKGLEQRAANRS